MRAMRRLCLILALLAPTASSLGAPAAPPNEADAGPTPYEAHLTARAEAAGLAADQMRQTFGVFFDQDTRDRLMPPAEEGSVEQETKRVLDRSIEEAFGPLIEAEGVERWLAVRLKAYRTIALNDHDRAGIAALAAADYAKAKTAFGRSAEADPDRGLPHLLKGIAHLEALAFADALPHLRRAGEDADCQPAAALLGAFAQRCVDAQAKQPRDTWLPFLDAVEQVERERHLADWMDGMGIVLPSDPFTETPALLRAHAEVIDTAAPAMRKTYAEAQTLEDPTRDIPILLAASPRMGQALRAEVDAYLAALPADHPLALDAAYHGLIDAYLQADGKDDRETADDLWAKAHAVAEAGSRAEPGNGYWKLLQIEPREVWRTGPRAEDEVTLDLPLTEAERTLLAAAASADHCIAPRERALVEADKLRRRWMGGFAQTPSAMIQWQGLQPSRKLSRRIGQSLRDATTAGDYDGVRALLADARQAMAGESPAIITFLVGLTYEAQWRGAMREALREPTPAAFIDQLAESRETGIYHARSTRPMSTVAVSELLPLRLIDEARDAVLSIDSASRSAQRAVCLRDLSRLTKAERDDLVDSASLRFLDADDVPGSTAEVRMVELGLLGELGDTRGRAAVEAFAGRGDAVTKRLVTRALARIEAAQASAAP